MLYNEYAHCLLPDVGRSCILVSLSGKNVMLDCGMHMGYNDEVKLCLTTCNNIEIIELITIYDL